MNYKIVVRPSAENDIDNAYDWYEEQQIGVGDSLLDELREYYQILEKNPSIFAWANKAFRRAVMQRFPFIIYYKVIKTEVHINAVFHTSRKPVKRFR